MGHLIESEIESGSLLQSFVEGCLTGIFHDRYFLEDTGAFSPRKTLNSSKRKFKRIAEMQIQCCLQELPNWLILPAPGTK